MCTKCYVRQRLVEEAHYVLRDKSKIVRSKYETYEPKHLPEARIL